MDIIKDNGVEVWAAQTELNEYANIGRMFFNDVQPYIPIDSDVDTAKMFFETLSKIANDEIDLVWSIAAVEIKVIEEMKEVAVEYCLLTSLKGDGQAEAASKLLLECFDLANCQLRGANPIDSRLAKDCYDLLTMGVQRAILTLNNTEGLSDLEIIQKWFAIWVESQHKRGRHMLASLSLPNLMYFASDSSLRSEFYDTVEASIATRRHFEVTLRSVVNSHLSVVGLIKASQSNRLEDKFIDYNDYI